MSTDFKFTTNQQKAYDLILKGENVFITGPSGTGKSLIINTFKKYYASLKNIAITSTTGISALLIGGSTLHSYLGIGLGNTSVDDMVKKIMKNQKILQRWKTVDVLIIDEISMLSPDLFDKLEEVARIIRRASPTRLMTKDFIKEYPFGGIQLILSGDFLQLPVVGEGNFCFEAKSWKKCIQYVIHLDEIMRQTDPEFQEVLNDLRFGNLTQRAKTLLISRMKVSLKNDLGITPTRIYTVNADVDTMNEKQLDKLAQQDNEFYQYDMEIYFYKYIPNPTQSIEKYKKNCIAPSSLQLCEGAQVMLLVNLDIDCGLVNGSRGVVISFFNDLPIIKFGNGEERMIGYHSWEIEEDHKKFVKITQIPLKLAWAITVHKCVEGDTIIYTEKGMKRISDLVYQDQKINEVRKIDIKLHGIEGEESCSKIFRGDTEDTLIIRTSKGFEIEGSYRHPVLTEKKIWKKLPDIEIGDKVYLKKATNCYGNTIKIDNYVIDEELSYLFGIICSRCIFPLKSIEFISYKNIDYIQKISFRVFQKTFQIHAYEHLGIYMLERKDFEFIQFLEKCGISSVKKVPWSILSNTKQCQVSFIKAVFDENAKFDLDKIVYSTHHLRFAHDIHNMLLNIGIVSTLTVENDLYSIQLDNNLYSSMTQNIDTELFLDEVVSITKSINKVYDVYVPTTNTFVGNGIINHNSQGATLDLAEISLSKTFEYGQAYVALSRVKSKEGLKILDIDMSSIQANPKAVNFYKESKIQE